MWFVKVFRGREEPEEKEKLSDKSIGKWNRGFRKWEVTGAYFGMEALTWGETCHSGYGGVETAQVCLGKTSGLWWGSLGESPHQEALVSSQRTEKVGRGRVGDVELNV